MAGRTVRRRFIACSLLLICAAQGHGQDTLFLDGDAFAQPVLVEIVPGADQAAARDALVAALEAVREVELLTDPEHQGPRGIAALHRGAAHGPVEIAPALGALLSRAQLFCRWSQNGHGPLGGALYAEWGLRRPVGALPSAEALADAVASARCDRLVVSAREATLLAGSRVEPHGFVEGFAVDQAIAALEQHGVSSGRVRLGPVERAWGAVPGQHGWRAQAALREGETPAVRVVLKDQALAVATPRGRSLEVAGDHYPRYLDQRTGRPVGRDAAVVVVTELAVDAQALAVALLVLGAREGQYRLSPLRPRPAVLYVSALDAASPLEISLGFAALEKWTPEENR